MKQCQKRHHIVCINGCNLGSLNLMGSFSKKILFAFLKFQFLKIGIIDRKFLWGIFIFFCLFFQSYEIIQHFPNLAYSYFFFNKLCSFMSVEWNYTFNCFIIIFSFLLSNLCPNMN